MSKPLRAILPVLLLLPLSDAHAFDGNRSGFLIGLSIGSQSTDATMEITDGLTSMGGGIDGESGMALSWRIGGGVSEKGTLYLLNQANVDDEDSVYGLFGLGGSYYFNETGLSPYVHGGLGMGYVSHDDEQLHDATGGAALVGVGIEPVRGLHIDLNYLNVQAEDDTSFPGLTLDYDIDVTQVMVGFTWF